MNLFVDESGSITRSTYYKHRYFVIAFLETNDPYKVIREFRNAKKDFIKKNNSNFDIKDEIKGSKMSYGMKKEIFQRLSSKTDATFHFKVIDNFNLIPDLINRPALSFNYFVYLTVNEISKITEAVNQESLTMRIDDRNTAVESLNSLQEYLTIKFSIEDNKFIDIDTKYKDSKTKDLIQVVDIYANTVLRICRNHAKGGGLDKRNRSLIEICNKGCSHYFPWRSCSLDICQR